MYITCDPAVLRIYSADGMPAPGQLYARKHVKILIAALPIILKGREVGGGVQDGEHMHTRGRFMSMHGKTNTML